MLRFNDDDNIAADDQFALSVRFIFLYELHTKNRQYQQQQTTEQTDSNKYALRNVVLEWCYMCHFTVVKKKITRNTKQHYIVTEFIVKNGEWRQKKKRSKEKLTKRVIYCKINKIK